ncbi:hypothetical protein ACU686_44750 [Yinghuangia aomiensis]
MRIASVAPWSPRSPSTPCLLRSACRGEATPPRPDPAPRTTRTTKGRRQWPAATPAPTSPSGTTTTGAPSAWPPNGSTSSSSASATPPTPGPSECASAAGPAPPSASTPEQVAAALDELAAARFVVVDHDTEEVLVRTFIRNDGVYKQPRVMGSRRRAAAALESTTPQNALAAEMDAVPVHTLDPLPRKDKAGRSMPSIRDEVAAHVAAIRALGHPAPAPAARPAAGPGARRPRHRPRPRPPRPCPGPRRGRPRPRTPSRWVCRVRSACRTAAAVPRAPLAPTKSPGKSGHS